MQESCRTPSLLALIPYCHILWSCVNFTKDSDCSASWVLRICSYSSGILSSEMPTYYSNLSEGKGGLVLLHPGRTWRTRCWGCWGVRVTFWSTPHFFHRAYHNVCYSFPGLPLSWTFPTPNILRALKKGFLSYLWPTLAKIKPSATIKCKDEEIWV